MAWLLHTQLLHPSQLVARQRERRCPTNHEAAKHGTRYAHHVKLHKKTGQACMQFRQYVT